MLRLFNFFVMMIILLVGVLLFTTGCGVEESTRVESAGDPTIPQTELTNPGNGQNGGGVTIEILRWQKKTQVCYVTLKFPNIRISNVECYCKRDMLDACKPPKPEPMPEDDDNDCDD